MKNSLISYDRFPPEADFLLLCHRGLIEPAYIPELDALIEEGIDWESLLNLAQYHGLVPHLFLALKKLDPIGLPKDFTERLKELHQKNVIRNTFLTNDLFGLIRLFEENNIPAVPYKGPVLAKLIYGDYGLRQSSDLDFIVKKGDIYKVVKLLSNNGYYFEHDLTKNQIKAIVRNPKEHELEFISGKHKTLLEIHWNVSPGIILKQSKFNFIWDRVKIKSIDGMKIPMLALEDLLLVLCIHGWKHNWERLDWVSDIAGLLFTNTNLDWEIIFYRAKDFGGTRLLIIGLQMAHHLYGAKLPDIVIKEVDADHGVKLIVSQISKELFTMEPIQSEEINLSRIFEQVRMLKRFSERAKFLIHFFITPNRYDIEKLNLPYFLYWFYYVYRPFRLANKYFRNLVFNRV